MFSRVLMAVERADQAPGVLAVAAALAKQSSLYGAANAPFCIMLAHATTNLLGSVEARASSAELAQLAEWLGNDGIEARYLLEFERPARGIVEAVTHTRADLVVLMPHGRHGLDRLMHPSVLAKLLARGASPLLIWPRRLPDTCARDLLSLPDSKVILPLDGSQRAERALPYAIDLANAYERSLLLVHIVPYLIPPMVMMGEGVSIQSNLQLVEQEGAQGYLRRIVEQYANDTIAPIETMTLRGAPEPRMLELACAHPCSVIVMSTHGRGLLARAALWSVTTATAQGATMPILVIPPHALAS